MLTDEQDRVLRDARAKALTWHLERGLRDEQIKAFLAGWDEAVLAVRRISGGKAGADMFDEQKESEA